MYIVFTLLNVHNKEPLQFTLVHIYVYFLEDDALKNSYTHRDVLMAFGRHISKYNGVAGADRGCLFLLSV